MPQQSLPFVAFLFLLGTWPVDAWASDTNDGVPYCNVKRTGYTPQPLAPPYRNVWVHVAPHRPRPAWREPAWEPQRIDFDYAYAVAARGNTVFYASSSDHALHALDLRSGEERWSFITDAPVRLAPEFHGGHVLFGSDDGYVYCLGSESGRLVWKYRPDIPDERLIGNEQMISRWPVRSGVLVEGDRVYAAFGMLSPEGVAVCCLDATSGSPLWINDTCGHRYMARPHVVTMGGVSPQGYMAVCGDRLVLTCGRSTPALFDKHTGACVYHEADGDFTGGSWTMTAPGLVFTPAYTLKKEFGSQLRRDDPAREADVFDLATLVALDAHTGHEVFSLLGGAKGVLSDQGLLTLIGRGRLLAVTMDDVRQAIGKKSMIAHTQGHFVPGEKIKQWSAPIDRVYTLLQAGETIIAGGRGTIECFNAADGKKLWQAEVDGQVRAMCIASGRLIASTTAGKIYCFRPDDQEGGPPPPVVEPFASSMRPPARRPQRNTTGGYCLALGTADADSLSGLAALYDFVLHATDADPSPLREQLMSRRLYGPSIVVQQVAGGQLPYTDYFADAIHWHVESPASFESIPVGEVYRLLHPCGGEATIACAPEIENGVRSALSEAGVPGSEINAVAGGLRVTRGRLPGAGRWTHQYADPGKTCASAERRVRLPLKAAWFGGLGPATIVSRHFRAPAPLVTGARCFVPGTDHLTAFDIYNGRLLWRRALPDLAHWPAAYRGPSLAVDDNAVYALQGERCLVLDPSTGETRRELTPPLDALAPELVQGVEWEYVAVVDDFVIGTLGNANIKHEWWSKAYPVNYLLFAMDAATGALRWVHEPEEAIDSSAIAIDGGRVFLIDGRPDYAFLAKRRGHAAENTTPRTLRALDLETGDVLWETADIHPTLNSLWTDDGVVLATTAPFARSMVDTNAARAGGGVTAYAADDGGRLWRIQETKMLAPFITDGVFYSPLAYDLKTGRPIAERGGDRQFSAAMQYLCSTASACPTLAMARQSSLGFRDLADQSGTYQYPIVRASCWINMIPAGGLVVVPEGGSSCMCAYNYKTSVALMPDERHFHFGIGDRGLSGETALRINFGAPGDRPDREGNVWRAYPRPVAYGRCLGDQPYGPKAAGPKPPIEELDGTSYRTWGRNPDWTAIDGTDAPWLFSFGLQGPIRLRVRPPEAVRAAGSARVVLRFCELETPESPRVFDVALQGVTVLEDFQIAGPGRGPRRAVTREFIVSDPATITLELTANDPNGPPPIISSMAIYPD